MSGMAVLHSMQQGTCAVHRHREMVPVELHHIWPKGMGGPNIASNKIPVCANGHYSIHFLMDAMLKTTDGKVPWSYRMHFGKGVRKYATQGYLAVVAHRAK